ncbi:MAG: DUF4424 family protein [Terracidiphilus sp.]
MAFPVPPYGIDLNEDDGGIPEQSFQSFRLWVDGKPVQFEVDATATLNGKDVTQILTANHIDIPTLGHFMDWVDASHTAQAVTKNFERLPEPARDRLLKDGLFDGQDALALWTDHIQYHWTQTFPAHSTVHIRHEYTPVEGFQLMPLEVFKDALKPPGAGPASSLTCADEKEYASDSARFVKDYCPDPAFLREVRRVSALTRWSNRFWIGQPLLPFAGN